MESSEFTLQIPHGSVLTPMKGGKIYDIKLTDSIILAPSVAVWSGKRKCERAEQDDFDF